MIAAAMWYTFVLINIKSENYSNNCILVLFLLLLLLLLLEQRHIVVNLSRGRSVGLSVRTYMRRSVGLSSALWKTADRIRMPIGIVGRTGSGMRQVVGFGDRSTGRGTLGANLGRAIVQRGL